MGDVTSPRILVAGNIFTADDDLPWAEAMAVIGDTIVYVGGADEARRAAGDDASVIDAGAGAVIPGFVDGHTHLLATGAAITRAALRSATTLDEITGEVRRWADANPDAPRVLGVGWMFTAVPDRTPTRQLLDAVVADRPVYLDASDLHSVWCNTAALDELGIIDSSPTRSAAGSCAMPMASPPDTCSRRLGHQLAWPTMNMSTPADDDRHLHAAIDAYLAARTTAAVEMALHEAGLEALLRADAAGRLPFTVSPIGS